MAKDLERTLDEESLSRRGFLGFGTMSLAGLFLTNIQRKTRYLCPGTPEWQIPEASEMIKLLGSPEFFTGPINDKIIFTRQFDPEEYDFDTFDTKEDTDSPDYRKMIMNNSCGQATMATILKLYNYFQTGVMPDITAGQVITKLSSETYEERGIDQRFIEWDNAMRFRSLQVALEQYQDEGHPISILELTRIAGRYQPTEVLPSYKIKEVIEEANDLVFSKGGVVVAFVGKYNYGHFTIFSQMSTETKHPTAMVVDSRGFKSAGYPGIVGPVTLAYYLENWFDREGFFGALGVVPNFPQRKYSPRPRDLYRR